MSDNVENNPNNKKDPVTSITEQLIKTVKEKYAKERKAKMEQLVDANAIRTSVVADIQEIDRKEAAEVANIQDTKKLLK